MSNIPANSRTLTDWYKQDVYDQQNNKIGDIKDVLVEPSGQIDAAIVGVGGKDVAVKFGDIKSQTTKDNKTHLAMNATKDALQKAPGFKYDNNTTSWVPDNKSNSK
jgi:sporulation protein YlmC with PRC-barrel domain